MILRGHIAARSSLRALLLVTTLTAVGCTNIVWPGPSAREPAPAQSSGTASASGSTARIAIGEAAGEDRQEQLVKSSRALLPAQVGYFMDVHEAQLRQAISGTDIRLERGVDHLLVTVPGGASFASSSEILQPGIKPALAATARVIAEFDKTMVVINGHTDDRGDEGFNRVLSERRALAVARELRENGVAAERLVVIGMGESQPLADNSTPAGQAANRRIEILLQVLIALPPPPDVDRP